eukprot:scaffold10447_cov19-Tisochrysis_lutea.AAC.4
MGWCSRVWLHAALSLCVQVDSPDMGWRSGGEGVPEMGIHSKMWPRTVLSLHGQVENSGAVLGHQDHHVHASRGVGGRCRLASSQPRNLEGDPGPWQEGSEDRDTHLGSELRAALLLEPGQDGALMVVRRGAVVQQAARQLLAVELC